MLLNEQQFSARVVAALDGRELPARVANRLMLARARALDAAASASPAGHTLRTIAAGPCWFSGGVPDSPRGRYMVLEQYVGLCP